MLNDDNINLSANELSRARTLIRKIVDNKLSKYNHQPIYTPEIGVKGRKKVLVIDQNATDMSVTMGGLDKNSFRSMLSDAVNENPNCDIIVKTHPDVLTGNVNGFFDHLHDRDNFYIFRAPINPICLLQYVDKVYVGTSQLGFEALMCGKETHVYGTPFYSNWGVTVDNVACARRTRKRSIEEIFYITYIIYSYYINPETEKHIEIEEAIDYLIKLRVEYSDYLQNGKKVCENIKSKQSAKDKIYKYISEHSDERIVFWGASTFLQDFFNDNKNIIPNVEAIVDADESKRSTRIHGIEIKPPEFIDNAGKITLISSLNNDHDIRFEAIKRYVFSSINARCINLLDDFFC